MVMCFLGEPQVNIVVFMHWSILRFWDTLLTQQCPPSDLWKENIEYMYLGVYFNT